MTTPVSSERRCASSYRTVIDMNDTNIKQREKVYDCPKCGCEEYHVREGDEPTQVILTCADCGDKAGVVTRVIGK